MFSDKMITYVFVCKSNRLRLEQVVQFRAIKVLQSKTNATNTVRELKIYIKIIDFIKFMTGTKSKNLINFEHNQLLTLPSVFYSSKQDLKYSGGKF